MSLNDPSFSGKGRITREPPPLGNDENKVQQRFYAGAVFCRNRRPRDVSAERLKIDGVLHERCLRFFHIRVRLVYFIYGNDKRNLCRADTLKRFQRLRLDTIVGGDDEYRDIGDISAARADGLECGVPWSINERDAFPRRSLLALGSMNHFIRGDVLGNSARLARNGV